MSEPLRVLVADDHPPTRAGVRSALQGDGFEVVAEVADGGSAVTAAVEYRPDVCVLDIHMPGGGGIPAAAQIAQRLPGTAIVMLTASREDEDLFDALRAGAAGYLLKDIAPERLGAALRGVLAGEAALPRSLVLKVLEEFRARPPERRLRLQRSGPNLPRLTGRESEVLDLMQDGLTTEEIAERLFISQVTVRTHVANILKKLRVTDRAAAVRLANGQRD